MDIKVFNSKVSKEGLLALAKSGYGDMVKGVVDLNLRRQVKNIVDEMIIL